MSEIVALIPLRGGSKSIPGKNIKLIAGRPLCAWSIEAAHKSNIFSHIIVSTDSEKIAEVVHALGYNVDIIFRPAEFATDSASTESVMLHASSVTSFETLVTIQATSPLVSSSDFVAAQSLFLRDNLDSLLTAVRTKRFYWHPDGTPLNYNPLCRPRRQEFSGSFMENGAFYFTKRSILESLKCRLGGKVGIYEMSPSSAVEIDDPGDWVEVERLLKQHSRSETRTCSVRMLVVDVDGTLTDAGMYYSAEGETLKKFNTRDAKGLEMLRGHGVEVVIMTSEDSPIVKARAKKLRINNCYTGVQDKLVLLNQLCSDRAIHLNNVAYVGDDVNDVDCLKAVGFSACPSDAIDAAIQASQYVSPFSGGRGAVRDVCEYILNHLSLPSAAGS